MPLLPRPFGARPRLAVEVRAEGIVAARAAEASSQLAAVSRVELGPEISIPQLRAAHGGAAHPAESPHLPLSSEERAKLTAAIRSALESVAGRGRETTLIVPDAAVRVLLLDFDALPAKPVEALSIVRFRLKKLVPFDIENAAVRYQVLSSARGSVQVLAVAIPEALLAEYENLVRDAGFEPGAVIPSTLAVLAALPDDSDPVLLVNAGRHWATTAIVHGDALLLHRSVELEAANPALNNAMDEIDRFPPATPRQAEDLQHEYGRIAGLPEDEWELAQAVSVASAYFEDTMQKPPRELLAAGTLPASTLAELLQNAGVGPIGVSERMTPSALAAVATGAGMPLGWLAGVQGALAT